MDRDQKGRLGVYIICLTVTLLISIISVVLTAVIGLQGLHPEWVVNVSVDVFCIFVCDILLLSAAMENANDELNLRFTQLITFIGVNLFFDMCCWYFDGHASLRQLVFASNSFFYAFNNLIPLLFWEYICAEIELDDRKSKRGVIIYALSFISIIEIVINLFYPLLFTVSESGVYQRTGLFFINVIPANVCALLVMITSIQHLNSTINKLVVVSYVVFPLVGMVIQILTYGISIATPLLLLSMILVYTQMHLNRKKKMAEQEILLSKQSVALMVSQIQPHFLYNVLTTISNLCRTNPEEAEEVTVKFSHYLRANLDAMRKEDVVPFNSELRHIKIYLELEKKRFGDRLNYEFDIKESSFNVPSLSIQPIVENSVKHGICDKGEPGTVKISTGVEKGDYVLIVEDDGVGFDTSAPVANDGRSHVGMTNTMSRLEKMVGAKTEVISSPGNGCKTIIRIPK